MKICVSSTSTSLDSTIDPRFGRCSYFLIVDSNDLSFESCNNPAVSAMGGAGIQAAQFIANKGVNVLITGNVGPKAFSALNAANIKVYSNMSGTVKEVVTLYNQGKLKETVRPSVKSHQGRRGFGGRGIGRRL